MHDHAAPSPVRLTWDEETVAYVRQRALDGASAAQVCVEIGLPKRKSHVLYKLARRRGFVWRRRGRAPDDGTLVVNIERMSDLNTAARARGIPRAELAGTLLDCVLASGPVLIANLLDEAE